MLVSPYSTTHGSHTLVDNVSIKPMALYVRCTVYSTLLAAIVA